MQSSFVAAASRSSSKSGSSHDTLFDNDIFCGPGGERYVGSTREGCAAATDKRVRKAKDCKEQHRRFR
jgi:hypothetical protein